VRASEERRRAPHQTGEVTRTGKRVLAKPGSARAPNRAFYPETKHTQHGGACENLNFIVRFYIDE
jgi:hypothetical protein